MSTSPDLWHLLRSTADAFEATLHAVLDGDRHQAREVRTGSADRRAQVALVAQARGAQPGVPAPQRDGELRYLDDLRRVNDLVDLLARQVVSARVPMRLSPLQRMETAVLLDAGGRRLGDLMAAVARPPMDAASRGCGSALLEVADHGGRDGAATMSLCGALAVVLLQASRHAVRAA